MTSQSAEPVEERGHVLKRLVPRQHEMVNQGKSQHHVGPPAVEDRSTLLVLPAERGRRVREVLYQRQEPRRSSGLGLEINSLDARGVRLECESPQPQLACQEAEISGVGAEVPNGCRVRLRSINALTKVALCSNSCGEYECSS